MIPLRTLDVASRRRQRNSTMEPVRRGVTVENRPVSPSPGCRMMADVIRHHPNVLGRVGPLSGSHDSVMGP